MEQLPTELRRHILRCLDIPSLKALRRCSSMWASLGEEYLLDSTFITYPHRDDFTRLQELSKHPRLSSYIETLEINLGEVNEYHARHNTYFMQYTQEPEYRDQVLGEAWAYLSELKLLKMFYESTICDEDYLRRSFRGLSGLKAIAVSLHKVPGFTNPLFENVWRFPSTRALPRVLTWERFSSLLSALSTSSIRLERLSHDRLPFEFFAQRPATISHLTSTFANLQFLSLQLDYSEAPNNIHINQGTERLAYALRSAPQLRTLHLGFQGRIKFDISTLLTHLQAESLILNIEALAFEEVNIWRDETLRAETEAEEEKPSKPLLPFLTTLRLEGISVTEEILSSFITRHKTLSRLQLGGPGITAPHHASSGGIILKTGTLKSLLTTLRSDLRLQKFQIYGDIQEPEMLSFLLHPIYDDDWNELVPFDEAKMQRTKDYEAYVVAAAEWPEKWEGSWALPNQNPAVNLEWLI